MLCRLSLTLLPLGLLTFGCADSPSAASAADDTDGNGPADVSFDSFKADAPPSPTTVVATALGNPSGQGAVLELVVTDVWGRLPDRKSSVRLIREADGKTVTLGGYLRPILVRLARTGDYRLEASIPEHNSEKMRFTVAQDAGGAFRIAQPADQVTHWSFSVDGRNVDGRSETVSSLYIGLEHSLFAASGPPPRRGNQIEIFDNGRDAFDTLAGDLDNATKSFELSLWLLKSDFELRRSPNWMGVSATGHASETILTHLQRTTARTRILLAEFGGREDGLNEVILDDAMEAFGDNPADNVELMLQANTTEVPYKGTVAVNAGGWSYRARLLDKYPEWAGRSFKNQEHFKVGKYDRDVSWTDLQVASYHQKFAVLDNEVAYLGGMNMNYADWDRPELQLFDPLRVAAGTSDSKRADIEAGETVPAIAPRKDYMARVEGPLVHDIADLFRRRWDVARNEGSDYSDNTTPFTVPPVVDVVDPNDEGVQAQLNVTLPMPFWEHSLLEGFQRAVAHAEDYIYIEDQYFRAPLLNQMILDRMAVTPDLKLIVVTKDVPYKDPGRKWTSLSLKAFKDAYPDRVVFLVARASDLRERDGAMVATFMDVDVHSKMFMVDDEIMSVGSCNKNNRGVIYEGEANLFVHDDFLVAETRKNEWARFVGPDYADQMEDTDVAFEVFRNVAEHNDAVYRAWDDADGSLSATAFTEDLRPSGLVYTLDVPTSWFFDPGPDFY